MKPKFQADADLNHIILLAIIRRNPSIDFQSAVAADFAGLPDPEVLERATREDRILVTHDRRTMPGHFSDFISKKRSSGLIVVSKSISTSVAADDIILIWSATEAEEWHNRVICIPF